MRVAVCMWGVLRSLPLTLPSLKKHLFDVLDNANHVYDVYMHTFKVAERYTNLRSQERDVALNHSHWQLLQPAYIFVEDQKDFDQRLNVSAYLEPFGNPWGDAGTFTNHLRALNSLYHVTEALEAAVQSGTVQYDAVVFIRPDLLLLNDLPLHLLDAFPASTVFTADFHRSCHGAELNDRFAMGRYPFALDFGRRLASAWTLAQRQALHSESLTFFSVSRASASVDLVEIPFRFRRVRSNGRVNARDVLSVADPSPHCDSSGALTLPGLLSHVLPERWVARWGRWLPPLHQHWSTWQHHYLQQTCHPRRHLQPADICGASRAMAVVASPAAPAMRPRGPALVQCRYEWQRWSAEGDAQYTRAAGSLEAPHANGSVACHASQDQHRREAALCAPSPPLSASAAPQLLARLRVAQCVALTA